MLLPGCAKQEATGAAGKVALVRGCLMGSRFNAPGVQVLAGGVWQRVVVVPFASPAMTVTPRCGDDGAGSCHRSVAGSTVQWLRSGVH